MLFERSDSKIFFRRPALGGGLELRSAAQASSPSATYCLAGVHRSLPTGGPYRMPIFGSSTLREVAAPEASSPGERQICVEGSHSVGLVMGARMRCSVATALAAVRPRCLDGG